MSPRASLWIRQALTESRGKAAVFISGICGDYYNVVGLPVCELVTRMRRLWKENGIHE